MILQLALLSILNLPMGSASHILFIRSCRSRATLSQSVDFITREESNNESIFNASYFKLKSLFKPIGIIVTPAWLIAFVANVKSSADHPSVIKTRTFKSSLFCPVSKIEDFQPEQRPGASSV